jgi:hypothetical protein
VDKKKIEYVLIGAALIIALIGSYKGEERSE